MTNHTAFGRPDSLRSARKALGLTQAEMASMLGYGAGERISEIENGHRQITETVRRLLAAYLDGYRPDDWPHRT